MAHYSLNEIETSARKAARGAGMEWGLAEESGKATRWLAARGLPNIALLLSLLKENDGKDYDSLRPQNISNVWTASGGVLCPVIAGSTLNDLAHTIVLGQEIKLKSLSCPALILPILGRASKALGHGFLVSWGNIVIKILPDILYLDKGTIDDLGTTFTPSMMVAGMPLIPDFGSGFAADKPSGVKIERVVKGVPLSDQIWSDLQVFAARTYVPASDQSRLLGAGAGLTDND